MSDILENEKTDINNENEKSDITYIELKENKFNFTLKRKTNVIVLNSDKTYNSYVKKHIPTTFKLKDNYHRITTSEIFTGKKRNMIIYQNQSLMPITYNSEKDDDVYQVLLHSKVAKDWLNEIKQDFMLNFMMIGVGALIGAVITAITLKARL